jgi:peroxiredoxin
MRDALSARGIEIVAISSDSVEQAARHRARDGLGFTLLADPGLEAITAYGLENRTLAFATATLLTIPLGIPTGYRSMAVPTSLLIDEEGVVRWIDQADDYRMRGDEGRITEAIASAFGQ